MEMVEALQMRSICQQNYPEDIITIGRRYLQKHFMLTRHIWTAVANDYSYDEIYARLTRAVGNEGDILIGLSTSGNSKNVIRAMEVANELNMITIGMTGESGGNMKDCCEHLIKIPSTNTPRIQECHMIIGHTLCEIVESTLFPK